MRARPHDMQPRVMLLRNLMLQDGGREADVPALALRALTRLAESEGDDIVFGPAFVPAMQLVLVSRPVGVVRVCACGLVVGGG